MAARIRIHAEFHGHLLKHNEAEQYACNRPKCNHQKTYASPSELVEKHWRIDCQGFDLSCERCGSIEAEKNHDCIPYLLAKKLAQAEEIRAIELEIEELSRINIGIDLDYGSQEEDEEAEKKED